MCALTHIIQFPPIQNKQILLTSDAGNSSLMLYFLKSFYLTFPKSLNVLQISSTFFGGPTHCMSGAPSP